MDGECPVTRERDSVNRVRKCKHCDEMDTMARVQCEHSEPWTINELNGETKIHSSEFDRVHSKRMANNDSFKVLHELCQADQIVKQ